MEFLKSPTVIMDSSISFFSSVSFCFTYFELLLVDKSLYNDLGLLMHFYELRDPLCLETYFNINIEILPFFWLVFTYLYLLTAYLTIIL